METEVNETYKPVVSSKGKVYPAESHETASAAFDLKRMDVLEEKTEILNKKAKEIEKNLNRSDKRQNEALSFMMWVAGIIVVAFFLALIPLLFDYYKSNAERYEKFTRRIDQLKYRLDNLEKNKANEKKSCE
jgi:hypothetical protein